MLRWRRTAQSTQGRLMQSSNSVNVSSLRQVTSGSDRILGPSPTSSEYWPPMFTAMKRRSTPICGAATPRPRWPR